MKIEFANIDIPYMEFLVRDIAPAEDLDKTTLPRRGMHHPSPRCGMGRSCFVFMR